MLYVETTFPAGRRGGTKDVGFDQYEKFVTTKVTERKIISFVTIQKISDI